MAAVITVSTFGISMLLALLLIGGDDSLCDGRVYRVKSNIKNRTARPCRAHANPQLHVIMDRVCQLCHEMFSYAMPNFRAECSERCYKNSKFRNCLNMFSVLPADHPGGTEFTKLLLRLDDVAEPSSEE